MSTVIVADMELTNLQIKSNTIQGALYIATTEDGTRVAVKMAHARCLRARMDRHCTSTNENLAHEISILEYFESLPDKPKQIIKMLRTWDRTNDAGRIVSKCVMMEYLAGGDLFDLGKRFWDSYRRGIPKDMAAWQTKSQKIFGQIVRTLGWIHAHGVVHMDLSPENFVLEEDGETLRFIDFGMSCRCPTDEEFWIRGRRGKRPYSAPEVMAHLAPYDGRAADIFAAGAVLIFLVCGVADSGPGRQILCKVMNGSFDWLLNHWGYDFVADEVVDLIHRMTRRNPRDRITMKELLEHPYVAATAERVAEERAPEVFDDETFSFANLNADGFYASADSIRIDTPAKPAALRYFS